MNPAQCLISHARTPYSAGCSVALQTRLEVFKGTLLPREKHEGSIAGGESHVYTISLKAGEFAQITVEQIGVDLVITLLDSGGITISRVDRPSGAMGAESLSHIAQMSGEYRVLLKPLTNTALRGKYEIALTELRKAEPLDESTIVAERTVSQAELLRSKATAESLKSASGEFDHAIALWRALKEPREESIALYGLGWCYNPQGEYQKALSSFNRALDLARASNDHAAEALAISGIGWASLYLGLPSEALQAFKRSIELRQPFNDLAGQATCLNGAGWCHVLLDDPYTALDTLNRARAIRQSEHDVRGEGIILNSIGALYHRLGKDDEALVLLKQSAELLKEAGYRYGEANALSTIGWACLALKDSPNARRSFERALLLRRTVGDRAGEANTLYGLAFAMRQEGDLIGARGKMDNALDIVESIRANGISYDLNSFFFASVQDYYEFQIDLLMELDRINPNAGYAASALHVAERARARSMLDLLSESRVNIRQGVDPVLLERERDLRRKLNTAASLLVDKSSEAGALAAAKEIEVLTSQYRQVKADIRTLSPRYAAITQPEPLKVGQIQRDLLDNGTLLLEYALGEKRSFLWLVGKDLLLTYELPSRSEIETAARQFYNETNTRGGSDADLSTDREPQPHFTKAAENLSRMIIAPCSATLSNKRLLIVPDGALNYVPFAALPIQSSQQDVNPRAHGASSSLRATRTFERPLIANHEMVLTFSASSLALLRRDLVSRAPATKMLAVFADPVYSAKDQRLLDVLSRGSESHQSRESLAKLPFTEPGAATPLTSDQFPRLFMSRKEADQILSLAPASSSMRAVDFDASRTTAMSDDLNNYRILHFAVHTLIDNEHPDLSRIVLSRFDREGNPVEGSIFAHEIFNLKLSADLVVLSTCRSGLGKEIKGEGLMSLTRAFMYAGARRVIVSLWSVDDRATAELMTRFYRKLLGPEKLSPSAALRAAQNEMRLHPRWRSPYFWAGFVLQGDCR